MSWTNPKSAAQILLIKVDQIRIFFAEMKPQQISFTVGNVNRTMTQITFKLSIIPIRKKMMSLCNYTGRKYLNIYERIVDIFYIGYQQPATC